MKFICPLIVVKDIRVSRDFYENILDQKVKMDLGENISFEGDFAIHLESHYQMLIQNRRIEKGGNQFELYFEHDDLDRLENKLKEAQVEWIHEVMEQPWRQKVMRFYDPDQHIIEIGESLEHLILRLEAEGLNEKEIVKTIDLPADFVSHVLKTQDDKSK